MYVIDTGDCRERLRSIPDNYFDSIVTDPPYGLEFMGKEWDAALPTADAWRETLRVAKPGAYLVAFGGTRTWHRLACAIEDAGWEIRDTLCWMYGQGFPKSLDVSKAVDAAAGATRATRAGTEKDARGSMENPMRNRCAACDKPFFSASPCVCPREDLVAITDAARQWSGWGTALKPAFEPIILARKPLIGTVAANVLTHGVGGLNIDGCRIAGNIDEMRGRSGTAEAGNQILGVGIRNPAGGIWEPSNAGRWPANVCLDEEAAAMLDEQSGDRPVSGTAGKKGTHRQTSMGYHGGGSGRTATLPDDSGGASRFFYVAKASRSERTCGGTVVNAHPTVKPIALMRWLVRLVTPPGGLVLDPFVGSGTTPVACVDEGFDCIGIEQDAANVETARARLRASGASEAPPVAAPTPVVTKREPRRLIVPASAADALTAAVRRGS